MESSKPPRPVSVPKARPGVVRMLAQSMPVALPLIQFPFSETGFSVSEKFVV